MNKTIEFLNNAMQFHSCEEALRMLTDTHAIKVTKWKHDLYVLNYSQIESDKFHAITKECRSLVVFATYKGFELASQAFDRFFNYGEKQIPCKFNKLTAHEKMDGSLVTLWYDEKATNSWLYRTKSMIMPEGTINNWDRTWADLIESSLGNISDYLQTDLNYIFEVTSRENRVVVQYPEGRAATLLAVRTRQGNYLDANLVDEIAQKNGWLRPRRYSFNTMEECLAAAKELPNLEEGYVLFRGGEPMQKCKSPAYVAAHHLRGEGLNPKRCLQLVCLGEIDEYIAVFPDDSELLAPYVSLLDTCISSIEDTYTARMFIANQKEFALSVKDLPYAGCLFAMRGKGINARAAFKALTEPAQHRLLEEFL